MKMKSVYVFLGLCLVASSAFGQDDDKNIVKNPGFESANTKSLKKTKKIELAEGWFSPTADYADLYSKDAGAPEIIGVPNNARGMEEAAEGSNYAGIVAYSYNDKFPRTYVMTKLEVPLRKGTKYCVQFKVSLSDLSKYASNNIGAHLSKKALENDEKVSLIVDTHVKHSKNKVFNQQFNWETVCGVYEANGDEEWITIGNFATNKETKYEQMKKPATMKSGTQTADAYYFIDDVRVFQLDSIQECQCEKENIVQETDIIYTKQVITNKELTFAEKLENGAVYFASKKIELTDGAKRDLIVLAEAMKNSSETITVHGHCDAIEAKAAETDPSLKYIAQRRANVVKKFLEEQGVPADRLEVVSHDANELDDQGDSDISHAKNRRVELSAGR
jgi:outer membrane protein OmpA-like peptidoglycan-associated protein